MAIEVQPSLSPHLCVDGAAAAIDFYVKAFNAVELGRVPGPDGKLVHAALQINGSTVLLNDDFPEYNDGKSSTPIALGGTPVTIHLTVTDVDASFQQALDAGATVVAPLEDQFWGDRYGVVRDPFGHHWSLGQPVREVSDGGNRRGDEAAARRSRRAAPSCAQSGTSLNAHLTFGLRLDVNPGMYIPSRASGSEFDVVIWLMAAMLAGFGVRSSSGVVGSDPYRPNSRS